MTKKISDPKHRLGVPPKDYDKRKSIGVFGCIRSDFKCFEILRLRIKGKVHEYEVYVIPIEALQGRLDFHLSYHRSGKFHWAHNKKHMNPLHSESDYREAFKLYLRCKFAPCFCLRKGKNLSDNEMNNLLCELTRHVPFDFDVEEVLRNLKQKKFYRMRSCRLSFWKLKRIFNRMYLKQSRQPIMERIQLRCVRLNLLTQTFLTA